VDPFRARSLKDWIKLAQGLEELDVFWLEDFLPPENFLGYAEVSSSVKTLRIAAGEQLAGYSEFERLAIEGNAHVLQPDLSRCGGLTVGRQIAEFSQRRGIDCVPHAWLTDLLKAASLHLNAFLMNSVYLEYNVSTASILNHVCQEKIEMVDGFIPVPEGPGLGVLVDEKMVMKYAVDRQ
jgi:L-alanine-DL-glutamate epimerase-like enolase superfamily enzyme